MDIVNVLMAALPEADEEEKPSPVHSLEDSKPLSKQDSLMSVTSEAPNMAVDQVPALDVRINLNNPQVVILANAKDCIVPEGMLSVILICCGNLQTYLKIFF